MKLNEISSKKCWVVVHMTDSTGHAEDIEVEGVFSKSSEAERYIAALWRDYVAEELDEDQVEELDKIIDSDNFDIDKVFDFSNELDSLRMPPSFDQMMDEYIVNESVIDKKF